MLINPQTEKYAKEWYTYISRTTSHHKLKPRPNDRIDINVFEKCFVGEAHKNKSYNDCNICKGFSRALMQDYYYVINYGMLDDLNSDLDKFFNHFNKHK